MRDEKREKERVREKEEFCSREICNDKPSYHSRLKNRIKAELGVTLSGLDVPEPNIINTETVSNNTP